MEYYDDLRIMFSTYEFKYPKSFEKTQQMYELTRIYERANYAVLEDYDEQSNTMPPVDLTEFGQMCARIKEGITEEDYLIVLHNIEILLNRF